MSNPLPSQITEGMILYFDPQILEQLELIKKQKSFDTNVRPYCCLKIDGDVSTWAQMTDTNDNYSGDFKIKKRWKKSGDDWKPSLDPQWLECAHYLDGPDCTCIGKTSTILNALKNNIPYGAHRLISPIGVQTLRLAIIARGGDA